MDASELNDQRLNPKEVLTPQRSGNFICPVADGTVKKFVWGDQRLRTSTLTRDRPERIEEQEILPKNSDEWCTPSQLQEDSTRDDEEAKNDFCTITGEFLCRHHVEPGVKVYMTREESFPIPLIYIDVTRTTCTLLDVLLEKKIEDYWNVEGERELSDAWTGFTRFTLFNERPPDGYTWSGERLTRKHITSRPDNVWPDMWKHMSDAAKKKAKQRLAIEKPKLDNARHQEEYSSLNQTTKNSSPQWKPLGESWKFRCQQQCLVKIPMKSSGETHRNIGKRRTKYACTGSTAQIGPSRALADQKNSLIGALHLFYYHFFLGKTTGS